MAVVQNNNQQNQDNQDQNGNTQQQQSNAVAQPINVSGAGGAYSQGGGGSTPQQGTQPSPGANQGNPKATSSGRFTNLNSYLNANKNFNQQGGGLAGQMNQNFQNQQGQINQNLQKNQQQFQQQANQARQPYTNYDQYNGAQFQPQGNVSTQPVQSPSPTLDLQPTLANRSVNSPQGYTPPSGYQNFLNSVTADPTAAVNNQDTFNKFVSARDANYTGPNTLTGQTDLQQQAQNYQQQAQQAQNENGRFGLLKQMFYNPGYSNGQQSLDNLMLQANPNQIKQLQTAQTGANKLTGNINQASSQAAADASKYNNEAQNISSLAKGAIGTESQDPKNSNWTGTGALGNFINQFTGDKGLIANTQNSINDKYSKLQSDLAANKLTPDEVKGLGIQNQGIGYDPTKSGIRGDPTYDKQLFNEAMNMRGSPGTTAIDPNATYTYGMNLSNYLNPNDVQVNQNSVANQDQFNQYNALNKLAGNSGNYLTDPTQAGKATGFDVNSLLNNQAGTDISNARNQSTSQINDLIYQMMNNDAYLNSISRGVDGLNAPSTYWNPMVQEQQQLLSLLGQKYSGS